RPLEVNALSGRIRRDEDEHVRLVLERLLRLVSLFSAHSSMDDDNGVSAPEQGGYLALEAGECAPVLGVDNDLLVWRNFRRGQRRLTGRRPTASSSDLRGRFGLEDFAQKARELAPFPVLSTPSHVSSEGLEALEGGDFRFQLPDRPGRGGL